MSNEPKKPIDTSDPSRVNENLLVAMGGDTGIEEQEAMGQTQLVGSDSLPSEFQKPWGCDVDAEAEMSKLGFELGKPFEDDPLFRPARLPTGWTKDRTRHSMWSSLLDEKGRQRAGIFYKAAFYDRKAHWCFDRRVTIRRDYNLDREHRGKKTTCQVTAVTGGPDGQEHVLYEVVEEAPDSDSISSKQAQDANDRAVSRCEAWLSTNYPDHNNPFAYWELEF